MTAEKQVVAKPSPVTAPPIVHEVARSPGLPIEAATREAMESRFGHDFSRVRVHVDKRAAESADAIDARAYTLGQDIVFGADRYAPQTHGGRLLLAHELVHTIQQEAPSASASGHQGPELEAEQEATSAIQGRQPVIRGSVGITLQRQEQTAEEIKQRLAKVRGDLGTGTGVRSNEATAQLREEEQRLSAALAQAQVKELQNRLAANRQRQSVGSGVRSPEVNAHLQEEQEELSMRLAIATSVASGAPGFLPPLGAAAPPGSPFINFGGGNLRGLAAETSVRQAVYPNALALPRGYPAVDFIEGGQRTPLTGFGKGAGGKLPLSSDSVYVDGGTLIQLKTMKNSLPYYKDDPNAMFNELSKGLEKLANVKPGAGKSERVGGEYRRVEHSGQADKKVLHVELEAAPTAEQEAQIGRLQEAGKSFGKEFGPGEEIDVVINWPGKTGGSAFKITSEGVVGVAGLALGIIGDIGRQKQAARQLETEGYAPTGLAAHAGDSWATQLGAFFRGDQIEEIQGKPGGLDIKVWRANVRQKAQAKKPGEPIVVQWQFTPLSTGLPHTEDVDVTYDKQSDGSWRARPVSDAPQDFHAPDLNKVIDPAVSDDVVIGMLEARWRT